MAKRVIASVESDFSSVILFLKKRSIVPQKPDDALIESAKRIHRATYSLILWRFRLKNLPTYGRVFVEEIASDALQILPQVLMGYGKTAKLLTRGIIENILRHLYFSDHPIEFERMNRDAKWYLAMDTLMEYPKIHPIFLESEAKFDTLHRLSSLYSELSGGIHGRTVQDLEMRVALEKIAYDQNAVRKQADLTEKCAEAVNFLLAMFHQKAVGGFQAEDRRIILRTMPPRARQACRDLQ